MVPPLDHPHDLRSSCAACCPPALAALPSRSLTGPALAHPHVWVTMKSEIVYAPDGTVTGVRHAWTFDDMFSTFATQGIETKKPRASSPARSSRRSPRSNVTSLKEFDYFTYATADGKKAVFVDPIDYWLDYKDSVLTLHFMLPFKTPVKAKSLQLEIYDPSYFVDFTFAEKDPVTLDGAPAACKVAVARPNDAELPQSASGSANRSSDSSRRRATRRAVRQPDRGDMPVTRSRRNQAGVLVLTLAAVTALAWALGAGVLDAAFAQAARSASAGRPRRRRAAAGGHHRLDPGQAGGVLSRAVRSDPRGQDRRQRGVGAVRPVVPLRRLSRRRAGPRQGGDLVLPRRQRGDLAARRRPVVRLGAAAGARRGALVGIAAGLLGATAQDDGRDGALDRDRELSR